jgi:hypothetical protein
MEHNIQDSRTAHSETQLGFSVGLLLLLLERMVRLRAPKQKVDFHSFQFAVMHRVSFDHYTWDKFLILACDLSLALIIC